MVFTVVQLWPSRLSPNTHHKDLKLCLSVPSISNAKVSRLLALCTSFNSYKVSVRVSVHVHSIMPTNSINYYLQIYCKTCPIEASQCRLKFAQFCYAFVVTGIFPGSYRITQLSVYRYLNRNHELSFGFPCWIYLPDLFTY